MNTTSKPYSSMQSGANRASAASDTMADAARGAVDAVKSTVGDAFDRGQAAVSNASGAANDMANDLAETANRQMKTLASELEVMARRNPLGTIAGAMVIGFLAGFVARG